MSAMSVERKTEKEARRPTRPGKVGEFDYPQYPYRRPREFAAGRPARVPVVVVGGGLVGLTIAVDLARKGVRCVLLDDNDTVSAGSRSIAQARRTMEIWSRMGCAEPMRKKGISWSKGHTHVGDEAVLSFTVFPEGDSRFPSFTSLAQFYVEDYLVGRAQSLEHLDICWLNQVTDVKQSSDHVQLTVATPEGPYQLETDWVVAADGAKSTVRAKLGLDFPGDRLQDRFVIADVRLDVDFPQERNFWFNPSFYEGNTVLRVPQSDSIWRIDWQIDPHADASKELVPEVVHERIKRIFGGREDFTVEWVSTYTSEHRLMDSFRHQRVFFVGDASHQFSPFGGGRGGNSGVQDADNLAWKLAAVVQGRAEEGLLDSYSAERRPIAQRNLRDSSRSTEFINPKSAHSLGLRDAVLALSRKASFAKQYINTGRFAVWPVLEDSPLSIKDDGPFPPEGRPGTPVLDCSLEASDGSRQWLTDLIGDYFTLVVFDNAEADVRAIEQALSAIFPTRVVRIASTRISQTDVLWDAQGKFASTYGVNAGSVVLFRPDQHVLFRSPTLELEQLKSHLRRTLHLEQGRLS